MEETLEELMRVLYPSKNNQHQNEQQEIRWNKEDINLEEIVNQQSITSAIKSFQPFKSPGPDNIYPALLQYGLEPLLPYLMNLYKSSLIKRRPAKS
jgi:hypothetical protein